MLVVVCPLAWTVFVAVCQPGEHQVLSRNLEPVLKTQPQTILAGERARVGVGGGGARNWGGEWGGCFEERGSDDKTYSTLTGNG